MHYDNGMPRTVVFLADAHQDASVGLHPAWCIARQFTCDIKPDCIILGGDFMEMGAVSPWLHDKDKALLLEGRRYSDDVGQGRSELEKLRKACPNSELEYLEGNHEAWLRQYLEKHPELVGQMDLRKDMDFDGLGINWRDENKVLPIGELNYIHGWYTNQNHAKKTMEDMGHNCMYGHMHEHQVFSKRMRSGQKPHMAMSVGCLCDLNPSYRRNKPKSWLHGFGFVEYRQDGTFQAHHLVIIDNCLTFAGMTWRAK